MAAETAPLEASPPKLSRYRSVRKAQAQAQQHQQQQQQQQQASPVPDTPPVPPISAQAQKDANGIGTVNRSMSRYHRRPTTSHAPVQTTVPLPTTVVPPVPAMAQATTSVPRNRALSSPQHLPHGTPPNIQHVVQPRQSNTSRSQAGATPLVAKGVEPPQTARDEAKQLIEKEAERQRRVQAKLKADRRAKLEAEQAERERREKLRLEEEEAARLKAQREAEEAEELRRQKEAQEREKVLQKAEDAARLKKREHEARNAHASPPTSPLRHRGLSLFGRRRKDDVLASPESPADSGRPRQTSDSNNRDLSTIRPGGGGAVLGIDAPISAINAGDRRVLVVCNKQEILLPVTPTTTPLDLIKSASICLTEPIDVRAAVILESFHKVGLKRPLRNYEHVRDVMNSWDDDKQNDLLIVDSAAQHVDQGELLASRVSDAKPDGMGCYIHYSSKPGKWSKRYLTLQSDGQLTMGKNEGSKDQQNICHLSDFDIYSPTEQKLSKIRPPKKICYAVKSQQKSNIYVDETRFVHFFCTNDRNTASLFHKSLHSWRSWYLVHVMGAGPQKSKAPDSKGMAGHPSSRNVSGNSDPGPGSASHARTSSVGSHYQLGSFMPLLDLDQFSKEQRGDASKPGSFPDDAPLSRLNSKSMHARKMSTRAKGPPPLSYSLGSPSQDIAPQGQKREDSLTLSNGSGSENDTFAPSSLLGRKYSERQRALQEKEQKQSGPFTEGPSLLSNGNWTTQHAGNDSGLSRRPSVQSSHRCASGDLQRSISTRLKPRPLVDLTPQYREPPQHARKGKGFVPEVSAGPLIENATSIEEAIKIPPSKDWRARPGAARPSHGTYGAGGYERARSLKGRGEGLAAYTVNNHSGAPEDDSSAFTGGGLLAARAGFSQGHTAIGHGVMDGSKARGPMLDMREAPKFASGSLLASVERQNGATGPAIDRSTRPSVDLG